MSIVDNTFAHNFASHPTIVRRSPLLSPRSKRRVKCWKQQFLSRIAVAARE
ncbi:hypothetical protein GGR40_003225 [Novosphingobium gossypii]